MSKVNSSACLPQIAYQLNNLFEKKFDQKKSQISELNKKS